MAKREWDKALYARFEIVLSPSQITAFLDCPRKWWFKSCRRMPEKKDQSKFDFGNVLHEVCQRWLEADDTGRSVKTGQPVDLYPEGWEREEADDGTRTGRVLVNAEEQHLIRKLVAKGIEDGLLRRVPGREIEKEFQVEVIPGEVALVEYLDLYSSEGVEDHKSTKSPKWIETQQGLANDPKMLTYAKVWLDQQWADLPADVQAAHTLDSAFPTVTLRLNYFVKDPMKPATKPVTVEVPTSDVWAFWEEKLVPAANEMLRLKRLKLDDAAWSKVSGPQSKGVCKKYGGCPYAAICSRVKHPSQYREETDRANTVASQPKPAKPKPMSVFGKKPAAKPAPVSAPAAVAEAEVPQQVEQGAVPPWHVPGCMACKDHPGINKMGQPCGACNGVRRRKGLSTSDDYELGQDEQGGLTWADKELPEGVTSAKKVPAAPKVPAGPAVESKPAKPAAVKKPVVKPVPAAVAPEPEPELEPADVVAEEPAPAPAPKQRKPRQKVAQAPAPAPTPAMVPQEEIEGYDISDVGPILFLDAVPLDEDFVAIEDILAREGAELAAAKGAESYYALHAFERRDSLAQRAQAVAEEFAGQNIVARRGSPDVDHYVTALKPFARRTIQGV